jgi:methionine biosynthesis protein MetW
MISDVILRYIKPGSRVLDLGCGDGELLAYLKQHKNTDGYGIDINFDHILSCIKKGISAYQGNLDEGLSGIPDQSFDYVILTHTLQEIHRPEFLFSELLRVGHKAIVTFPNFGHWSIRWQLLIKGQAPITPDLPYKWYNTPNIRVLTIDNFKAFCAEKNIKIVEEIPLYRSALANRFLKPVSNLLSAKGMFIITKA